MTNVRLTRLAQAIAGRHLAHGALAVDATAGNGHDTVFLARAVGAAGRVYAFDIQTAAIDATFRRLAAEVPQLANRVQLRCTSNARMTDVLPAATVGRVRAIMFNLGYLPGGDKTITTLAEPTCRALEQAEALVAADGVITVLAYPGHAAGRTELKAIEAYFARADGAVRWGAEGAAPGDGPRLFVGRRG